VLNCEHTRQPRELLRMRHVILFLVFLITTVTKSHWQHFLLLNINLVCLYNFALIVYFRYITSLNDAVKFEFKLFG
jgi:hypothetical protein